jgi:hypothetical protein
MDPENPPAMLLWMARGSLPPSTAAKFLRQTLYRIDTEWWHAAAHDMRAAVALGYEITKERSRDGTTIVNLYSKSKQIHTPTRVSGGLLRLSGFTYEYGTLWDGSDQMFDHVVASAGIMAKYVNEYTDDDEASAVIRQLSLVVSRLLDIFSCMIHTRGEIAVDFVEDMTSIRAVWKQPSSKGDGTVIVFNTAHLVPKPQGYRVGRRQTDSVLEYMLLLIADTGERTTTRVTGLADYNPHGVDVTSVKLARGFKAKLQQLADKIDELVMVPWEWYTEHYPAIAIRPVHKNSHAVTASKKDPLTGEEKSYVLYLNSNTHDSLRGRLRILFLLEDWDEIECQGIVALVLRKIFYAVADIFALPDVAVACNSSVNQFKISQDFDSNAYAWVEKERRSDRPVAFVLNIVKFEEHWRLLHTTVGLPATPSLAMAEIMWHESIHMITHDLENDGHGADFHRVVHSFGVRLIHQYGCSAPVDSGTPYPGIAYYIHLHFIG